MSLLAVISVEGWVGIIALSLGALGTFAGGVWWMASLYGKVCRIESHFKGHKEEHKEIDNQLSDLKLRMTKAEVVSD